MEKTQKSNTGLIVLIIVLLLVCGGMGGFIFVNKDKLTAKENVKTTVKNEKTEKGENKEECAEISYELKTDEYRLGATGVGINIAIDNTRKNVSISSNAATVSNSFSLGWATAAETFSYELIDTKTMDKRINQVIIDSIGQDVKDTVVLYLMEDGTVEYIPVLKDIKTNRASDNTKKFNSYGKLEGVSEIIGLIPAGASDHGTVLARKADGTVIDLATKLVQTGNFS